jgi:pSer/pThr/pTyr-binding forkhead associated (FHA) protein/tetratricopeptide (TPR) repeat protein
MLRLVISDDTGAKTIVPLVRDEITIGRAENNTIRLTERNVSRSHAQLRVEKGVCVLKDMGSYCGVTVNGTSIAVESEVKVGDRIGIGDYVLTLEVEADGERTTTAPGVRIKSTPAAQKSAQLPARIVMMTGPDAGAEFSVGTDNVMRLGRSDELEVTIDHRSVSREHAEITASQEGFRIVDLGSINGITINGSKVKEKALQSGDIIGLGEVFFRFVGQGEVYQFDREAAAHEIRAIVQPLGRRFWILATAAAVVTASVVGVVWYRGRETAIITTVTTSEPRVQAARQRQVDTWLQSCRLAIAGERFAEAMSHAAKALEIAPADKAAKGCKQAAERNYEQEQIFVRGKAELENNDLERAYGEFEKLEENNPYRLRPEVQRTTRELARVRVDLAAAVLGNDRIRAVRLAASVLKMKGVPNELRAAAVETLDKAKSEQAPETTTRASRRQRRAKTSTPKTPQPSVALSADGPERKPTKNPVPASSTGGVNALQVARSCLSRGDNQCIVRALESKAHSADELGLLIETYRSMGNNREAVRNMGLYLDRYPGGPRANIYRRILKQSK